MAAFSGTTFETSFNWPTAPLKSAGAGGNAFTSTVGVLLAIEYWS
jgi:hypothetical protein